nr:tryptophan--tRNA ligase [Fibrobacterota bacterium]
RDIAERINHNYKTDLFVLPEPRIDDHVKTIVGLDGRKMSKSYNNTIPLFLDEKLLLKRINQVVTNSQTPDEPKDPDQSSIYALHKVLLFKSEDDALRRKYLAGGMGWGLAKKEYFDALNACLQGPRAEYQKLMADPASLQAILGRGRDKARATAGEFLDKVRGTIGIR